MTLKVGLTGGIASGKTRVRRRFAAAGFRTVDLDAVSRDVMAPGGAAYPHVVDAFGASILHADGTIDRATLGRVVFADIAARRRLESIVHPSIRVAEADLLAGAGDAIAVVDAALLVETGSHLRFDRLVVVYCDPPQQLSRLMARDGLPEAAARARIDAQMAADEKRGFAHFVVDTSGPLPDTDAAADEVSAALRALGMRGRAKTPADAPRAVALMERGPQEGPRGLTPWGVADSIATAGTLDLARIAAMLRPVPGGPWYESADAGPPGPPPATLAAPVAIWCAGRRAGDVPFTVAAAASLARLTHRDGEARAGAVVAALAAQHVLGGGEGSSLREGIRGWVDAAAAWTGSPPPSSVPDAVAAAATHPGDPEAAARAAQLAGGMPELARAFAGGPAVSADADRLAIVARLLEASAV